MIDMDMERLNEIFRNEVEHYHAGYNVQVSFSDLMLPGVRWDRYGRTYEVTISDYFADADEDILISLAACASYNKFYLMNASINIWDGLIRDYVLSDEFLENSRPIYIARRTLSDKPKMSEGDVSHNVLIHPQSSIDRLVKAGLLTEDEVKDIIVVWDDDLYSNPLAYGIPVMKTVCISRKFARDIIPFNVRDYAVYVGALSVILGREKPDFEVFETDPEFSRRRRMFEEYQMVDVYLDSKGYSL